MAQGECVVDPELLRQLLHEVAQQHAGQAAPAAARLTAPEREVLRLITDGRTNRAIAQMLGHPVGTVKDYVQKVIKKLEVSDRTQAAVKAVRLGLV